MAAQRSVQMAQSFPLLMRPSVWRRLATAAASNEAAASEKPASSSVENTSRRVYLLNRTTPETTDLHNRHQSAKSLLVRRERDGGTQHQMQYVWQKARDPLRGNLVYPYPFGQLRSVLFFAEDAQAAEAKEAGADIVGGEELAKKVSERSGDSSLQRRFGEDGGGAPLVMCLSLRLSPCPYYTVTTSCPYYTVTTSCPYYTVTTSCPYYTVTTSWLMDQSIRKNSKLVHTTANNVCLASYHFAPLLYLGL
eukprot:Em0002g140a